jgi:MFS family permease
VNPSFDWAGLAPALRIRNFRLFWLGQIVSNLGTALQVVAEGWLIYELTQSTFWLGMVGLLALIPVVPISLLGGVLIDRVPRRKLIIATQVGLMAQAAVFALLAQSGRLQLWQIVVLYSVFGALLAIDHPARRAFLADLVDQDVLANAVALNGAIFNFTSFVGYMLSGLLIATIGAGGTMMVNALSYLATIAALLAIRVADVRHDTHQAPLKTAWLEGIQALLRQPTVLATIGLMAVVGGLAWPVFGMMPAFASEVLHVGSVGLGVLLAAGALGSIVGTVVIARLGRRRRGRSLVVASVLLPLAVMAFAQSTTMVVACTLVVGVGVLLLIVQSLAITLVQVTTANRIRGRVMSVYSMAHAGADTVGNAAVGSLAQRLGLPPALTLGGAVALIFALVVAVFVPSVRRLD